MNDSKHQSLYYERLERKGSQGYDHIWDAIPYYELMDFAQGHYQDCSQKTQSEIYQCAEEIVRTNICSCCNSDQNIVKGVVDEFIRHLNNGAQGAYLTHPK